MILTFKQFKVSIISKIFFLSLLLGSAGSTIQFHHKDTTSATKTLIITPINNLPNIDAKLDDEAWERVKPSSDFVQYDPDNGPAPTETTYVYVWYDIYFAFHCPDSKPDKIIALLFKPWENIEINAEAEYCSQYLTFEWPKGIRCLDHIQYPELPIHQGPFRSYPVVS